MPGIDDAQAAVKRLFDRISTGDDAEKRVDDIEQLAELKTILDGLESPSDLAPAVPAADPVAAAATNQPAVPAIPTQRSAAPAPARRSDRHTLRYRVDAPEGEARPGSKGAVGQAIHEAFSALKRSSSPGQTMNILTYKVDGVDYDQTGKVEEDIDRERSQAVLSRAAERINAMAHMTPAEAAATRVEAAAGFCAPPTPRHEFCEVDALAGVLDLATFAMPLSGVRLPSEPNVQPVYDNLACMTEADEIAREAPKPCWTIECVPWYDVTPCLIPTCIEVDTLTQWAFPALVDKVLAESMKRYEQFINRSNLYAIANAPGTVLLDFSGILKTGAINDIVSAALMAASQFRTKWRLDPAYPLRLVAESVVGDVLASDGNRRATDLEMLGLARAVIETTLAKHAIDVTWVYDWEDAQGQADPDGWGGQSYKTTWPTTADLLLFAPDSWQEYREELVRVQGLRQESTLMRDNKELALFVESAHATVQRCKETLRIRVPLCPAGTHQLQDWDPAEACPI